MTPRPRYRHQRSSSAGYSSSSDGEQQRLSPSPPTKLAGMHQVAKKSCSPQFVCTLCYKSFIFKRSFDMHVSHCERSTRQSSLFRTISDQYYNDDTAVQELIRANNTWTYNLDSLKRANFTIGHININSLANKYEHIRELLNAAEFDVLLLNETKLDLRIPSTAFMVPDYYLLRRDRNSRGGGIAIYINKCYRIASKYIHMDFELVHLKLQFNKRVFHIIATYKPPYERSYTYIKFLQSYVSKLNLHKGDDYFIVGDLNMNWLDESKGKLLQHFCHKNKFRNFVIQPTRVVDTVTSHYETLIDVVLHNRKSILNTSVIKFPFSDHSFVLVECDVKSACETAQRADEQQRLSRRLVDKTIASIMEIIMKIDFSILNDDKTVVYRMKKFNIVYLNIVNKKTPLRKIKHEELIDKHKNCVQLFKMYNESKSPRTVKMIVQKMMQFVSYLTYKLCHM